VCTEASTVLRAVAEDLFFKFWCLEIPSDNCIRHVRGCVHCHAEGFRSETFQNVYVGSLIGMISYHSPWSMQRNPIKFCFRGVCRLNRFVSVVRKVPERLEMPLSHHCEICSSAYAGYENRHLLRCRTVQSGSNLQTFRCRKATRSNSFLDSLFAPFTLRP
jgi:hypothetical protein